MTASPVTFKDDSVSNGSATLYPTKPLNRPAPWTTNPPGPSTRPSNVVAAAVMSSSFPVPIVTRPAKVAVGPAFKTPPPAKAAVLPKERAPVAVRFAAPVEENAPVTASPPAVAVRSLEPSSVRLSLNVSDSPERAAPSASSTAPVYVWVPVVTNAFAPERLAFVVVVTANEPSANADGR